MPANVQVYTGETIEREHHGALTDYLTQGGGSVSAKAAQGNPFQPDLAFRGLTASPLHARYHDFGVLGENFFTGPHRSFGAAAGVAPRAEQFRGPGVPRGVWAGTRYAFGADSARRGGED